MIHTNPPRLRRSFARAAAILLVLALVAGLLPVAALAQDAPVSPLPTESTAPAAAGNAVAPASTNAPQVIEQTVTLNARQDAYISSGFPNGNFGGLVNMNMGWQGGNGGQQAMRMLIQWDLSSIPRNATINSARVQLFQTQVIPVGDQPMGFRAQYMTQGWSEGGVTWNNANFLGGDSLPLGSVPGTIGWQSGDARSLIQPWVNGSLPNFGILVTGDETPSANRMRVFATRETSTPPQLVINFSSNCDNVPPTATVNSLPQFSPGSFRVSWTGQDFAPSGCNPSGIANYDIQYRINGGSWTDWQRRTTSTSATFNNIAGNGSVVDFRARATDNAGNVGSYTGTQTSTTVDSEPPVATMQALSPYQAFTSFTVNWTGSDNLSGIASYDVQFNINDGPWQTLVSNTTATSFLVTGAQALQAYNFRVRATDNVGNVGPWPTTPQATTTIVDFPVAVLQPIVPTVISSTTPNTTTVSLNWTGLTATGTTIASYRIYYQFMNQPRTLWQSVPASQTSIVFPLSVAGGADGQYWFTVTAVDNLGRETDQTSVLAQLGQRGVVLDLADKVAPVIWFPIVANDATP